MAAYRDKYLPWARQFLSRHDPDYRFRWKIYFNELERLLKDADSFLDAGCGDNQTVRELTFAGLKLGVDRARPDKPDRFCCARLEKLPFAAESFEAIGCRFVLEHLENPERVFAEFNRILKPGGYLLTQTTNRDHPLIFLARLLPRRVKRRLVRKIYGRAGGAEYPTYHRFNRPRNFQTPQAGLVPLRTWFVEDLHLESKAMFYVSYFYHVLTRVLRRTNRRSSITALWQKAVESPGDKAL